MDDRPGLNPARLLGLMRQAIERCRLDLSDRTVLTEAATGAYAVTAVLAAMAGADVFALAGDTAYATSDELQRITRQLAEMAGVEQRVQLVADKRPDVVKRADIITNSGQVRPIDGGMLEGCKDGAVIALMYESWEFRESDVDLAACRRRRIPVAGTNERHPAVDVFSYLGPMAIKQLHDAGVAVFGSRIVLVCDNDFAPFIARGLRGGGAEVLETARLTEAALEATCDAILSACSPRAGFVVTAAEAEIMAAHAPGSVLVDFWGDSDRDALAAAGVPVWPPAPPPLGHMAVLPSAVGPEPIVRLQAGGLKVGEVLARGLDHASPDELSFVQVL